MLIRIADYFGVSTDYLLGRTDNPYFERQPAPDTVIFSTQKDAPAEADAPTVTSAVRVGLPQDAQQLRALIGQMIVEAMGGHK